MTNSCIGQIKIADEVIAVIAGTAALEINGVSSMSGHLTGDIAHIIGKKNLSRGVTVEITENEAVIGLSMTVKFGFKLHEVTAEVQKNVKNAIETMTGLSVVAVNVNVTGITSGPKGDKINNQTDEAED